MPSPIRVEIYSRVGCHLCDEAKAVVNGVRSRYAIELSVIDIDRDSALVAAYGERIPVVLINGTEAFQYTVDPNELERKLKRLWHNQ
jgi:glutaredoxin